MRNVGASIVAGITLLLSMPGCGDGVEEPLGSSTEPVSATAVPRHVDSSIPEGRWTQAKSSAIARSVAGRHRNRLVVKFIDGTGVRSRDGKLDVVAGAPYAARARSDVASLDGMLDRIGRHLAMPAVLLPEEELVADPTGERNTLSNFYYVYLPSAPDDRMLELLEQINSLSAVEIAYASMRAASLGGSGANLDPEQLPWPTLEGIRVREHGGRIGQAAATRSRRRAMVKVPTRVGGQFREITDVPDFRSEQEYLGAAPVGVDSDFVLGRHWNSPGSYLSYVAIDYNWYTDHVDLYGGSYIDWICGKVPPTLSTTDGFEGAMHGTMTVGIISASDLPLGHGTEGIASRAVSRLVSYRTAGPSCASMEGWSDADAILAAIDTGSWGEPILLEWGRKLDLNGDNILGPNETVPAEFDPVVEQAIRRATKGYYGAPKSGHRVVIEPAGNGGAHLGNASLFQDMFVSSGKDTAAVMVGNGTIQQPLGRGGNSNYGVRIDVNAGAAYPFTPTVGRTGATSIGSLKGLDDILLYDPIADPAHNIDAYNHDYTQSCNGTSCASAIIAGTSLVLASVTRDMYGSFLQPTEMREYLKRGGSPQLADLTMPVGNRPDLRRQIYYVHNRHARPHSTDLGVGANNDGRADLTMWDPEARTWTTIDSQTGTTTVDQQVGAASDDVFEVPVPGTYGFRYPLVTNPVPRTRRVFFSCPWDLTPCRWLAYQGNGTYSTVANTDAGFGQLGDVPVPLDITGDGTVEPAVYRPAHRTAYPSEELPDPNADAWQIRTLKTYTLNLGKWIPWLAPYTFTWTVPYTMLERFPGASPTCPSGEATALAADFTGDGRDDLALVCHEELASVQVLKWIVWPYPFVDDASALLTFHHGEWGDVPMVVRPGVQGDSGLPISFPATWRTDPSSTSGLCKFSWFDHRAGTPGDTIELEYPAGTAAVGTFDHRCGVAMTADTALMGAVDSLFVYLRANQRIYRKDLVPVGPTTEVAHIAGDGSGYFLAK